MLISGVNIPSKKKLFVALTYIKGIGQYSAMQICKNTNVDMHLRTKDVSDEEAARIKEYIKNNCVIEGELTSQVMMNIRRCKSIGCYAGIRHSKGLPVNGQRTQTNAHTAKKLLKKNK